MPGGPEDSELLLRSAAGDSSAFELLFERHRASLHGFLLRRLRSQSETEDAVALTFLKAWRARSTYRGNTSGKAWLFQIATRIALDIQRRHRRHPIEPSLDTMPTDLCPTDPDDVVDPEAILLRHEYTADAHQAIHSAIDRLAPREKSLLQLYYFDGRSCEEISSLLGIPYSRVRGRLNLIRGRIRRDLVLRQQWSPC
jgi:RNA polymerase sigma-70 factor (ECF subfamily)